MSTFRFNWSSVLLLALWSVPLPAQQIAVEDPVISDFANGFGLPVTYEFNPGQTAHLAFRVRGLQVLTSEQPRRTRRVGFSYTIEAVDCSGRLLAPTHTGELNRLLPGPDGSWAPLLQHSVEIPQAPRTGTHHFHVNVADKNGGATASLDIPFEVQAPFDDPAQTLQSTGFDSTLQARRT